MTRAAVAEAEATDAEVIAQHAEGVRWTIRPLVDCALRHADPERRNAVAAVLEDAARTIRAGAGLTWLLLVVVLGSNGNSFTAPAEGKPPEPGMVARSREPMERRP